MESEPFEPMLAQLMRELPSGPYFYEPKWDGFRCVAVVTDGEVDLRSRHGRPLARYFPELVDPLRKARERYLVLDGEIVVVTDAGFDFAALLGRLHPAAKRVERLRNENPATFVAFDLVAAGDEDLRALPFAARRSRLTRVVEGIGPPILVTPMTRDRAVAEEWLGRFQGAGIDGVVAKHEALTYQPGRRAMIKVKREHTADCVIAGVRCVDSEPLVASLLLGLYQGQKLVHVGVSSSFPRARRKSLFDELRPLAMPLRGHPWEAGFNLGHSPMGRLAGSAGRWDPEEMSQDWMPLRPELVCEVAFDQVDAGRFRHPARLVRMRPDREATSCTFDQLSVPAPPTSEALRLR